MNIRSSIKNRIETNLDRLENCITTAFHTAQNFAGSVKSFRFWVKEQIQELMEDPYDIKF